MFINYRENYSIPTRLMNWKQLISSKSSSFIVIKLQGINSGFDFNQSHHKFKTLFYWSALKPSPEAQPRRPFLPEFVRDPLAESPVISPSQFFNLFVFRAMTFWRDSSLKPTSFCTEVKNTVSTPFHHRKYHPIPLLCHIWFYFESWGHSLWLLFVCDYLFL